MAYFALHSNHKSYLDYKSLNDVYNVLIFRLRFLVYQNMDIVNKKCHTP